MVLAEYDYDTDIAVQRAEERKIAFAEGVRQTAKMMKQSSCETDFIAQMTGLTSEEIEKL